MRSRPLFLAGAILLLALSAFYSTALAQSDWFSQNQLLKGLKDVTYAGADTWFAVGVLGSIYMSIDDGETWDMQESGTTETLYGVSFYAVDTGVVVGNGGLVLRTTDGGETWEPKTSGTSFALYNVVLTSASTGTAVGGHSTIIHTTDGGETWYNSSNDPSSTYNLPFYSLCFLDENFGVVVGGGLVDGTGYEPANQTSYLLKTYDGGASWNVWEWWIAGRVFHSIDLKNQDTMITAGYKEIFFMSDIDGIYGYIFKSNVGGGAWIEYGPYDETLNDIAYLGEDSWIAVGDGGTIYHTTNDGINWIPRSCNTLENLQAVHFSSLNTGIVVGDGGIRLKTIDGGFTWQTQNNSVTMDLYDIVFTDDLTAIAVGKNVRLRTEDGGNSWHAILSGSSDLPYYNKAVSFINPNTGVIVGGHYVPDWLYGRIWVTHFLWTTDGGLTFKSGHLDYSSSEPYPFFSVDDAAFIDDTTVVAVGSDVYWSWDAGHNWIVHGDQLLGQAIAFSSDSCGTIVNRDGQIYSTTNRGTTWDLQYEMGETDWYDVMYMDETHGWIVGSGGSILVTTDSGESWLPQSSGTGVTLRKISFTDSDNGTVVGEDGTILRTSNSGDTWTPDESGTTRTLYGVYFTDSETGTVVGGYGTILRTEGEPVAVMLQQYGAVWRENHAEVYWSLSGAVLESELTFTVSRSSDEESYFVTIPDPDIEESGTDFTLRDYGTEPGTEYIYHVDIYEDGRLAASFDASVETPAAAFHLAQNHPNPFNPSTEIRFGLPEKELAELRIYDVSGRLVRILLDEELPAGSHTARWDGSNDTGTPVASGIYFYRLRAGKLSESKKMVLLR